MGNLDPMHWVFIGIGALLVLRVLSGLKQPAHNLLPNQLPEPIRQEVEGSFPGFVMESGRSIRDRKFVIKGTYLGRTGRVEVELDRNGVIREFEYEELSGNFSSKSYIACGSTQIPETVHQLAADLLGDQAGRFELHDTMRGKANGEKAYKLKGRTPGLTWEFQVTETGRLIEFEREHSLF